jgi:hypothetical protein
VAKATHRAAVANRRAGERTVGVGQPKFDGSVALLAAAEFPQQR